MTEKTHVWPLLRRNLSGVHWARIENTALTGMADVNGCFKGTDAWIENKVVQGNRLLFQLTQPAWLIGRMLHGGRVFVLARKGDDLLLWSGHPMKNLLMQCKPQGKKLVVDHRLVTPVWTFAQPYDWGMFQRVIFGHE